MVNRSDIEHALDDLVSFEEGGTFQSLAVILAKQRWPDLIACERKCDHGLDALALPRLGLACSITPTLSKIKGDAQRACSSFPNLETLIFYTLAKITNNEAIAWSEELARDFRLNLIVVSREDLITSLMDPANVEICRSHLHLPVPLPEAVRDCLAATREACVETINNWFRQLRLRDHPLIHLNLARIHDANELTAEAIDLNEIQQELGHGRRLIMKAPPGAGKTTTLLQLAEKIGSTTGICIVVDLPGWINSGSDLLEFVAQSPAFRSRGLNAEGLAGLFRIEHVDFLLNGWNEIAEAYSVAAAQTLRNMERDYPGAGILLATRAHGFEPPLPGAWQVTVRELSVEQRSTYLSRLLGERSGDLLSQITVNPTLEALTRTPLILSEVARLFEAGRPIPTTKLDILDAMVRRIEESEEHRTSIEATPLSGRARSYLSALALRMTDLGRVDLSDEEARDTLTQESAALQEAGQLATILEPQSIATALCAHHVLQRLHYPKLSFRFQHQQFQEFYATLRILELLKSFVDQGDEAMVRDFQIKYLDRPVWEEALTMVADAVGAGSLLFGSNTDLVNIGERLVRCTISIDPIFAAALARRSGEVVWSRIGAELGTLLRRWYAVDDAHHRRCALAAMLATGSVDFRDIILPLLTNSDQRVRIESFRALGEFYPSSLGPNWRSVVAEWNEEQRCEFVCEVQQDAKHATLAEEFATSDPSSSVRVAATQALFFIGAHDKLMRVLDSMDGPDLCDAISHGVDVDISLLSEAARARFLSTLRERADGAEIPADRLRAFTRLAEFRDSRAPEDLRATLTALTETDLRGINELFLVTALKAVRTSNDRWADIWISKQIAGGVLDAESWISRVGAVPQDIVAQTLTQISSEEINYNRLQGVIALITKALDPNLAKRIWQRLFEVSAPASGNSEGRAEHLRAVLRDQMQELASRLPPVLRVSGAVEALSAPSNPWELREVLEVFGRATEDGDLHAELPDQLCRSLRDILVGAIPYVLEQEDFFGSLKTSLALALARVGGPENAREILQLIRADIERIRSGLKARARGERGPQANGACQGWSNWYVKALRCLGADVAEPILINLLEEPEYEDQAASALSRLALPNFKPRFGLRILERPEAPEARESVAIDEARRTRYAEVITSRISVLLEEYDDSERQEHLAIRLKSLALVLAQLNGRNSIDLILRVMALPGTWDGWKRVDALDELLQQHSRLPTDPTLAVLNPTINHLISQGLYDDQNTDLLKRCLCILPFVDNAASGIGRIREILSSASFGHIDLRDLVVALARSGSEEALDLLIELASTANFGSQYFAKEWITAVGAMDLPRARTVLMGFIDPGITARVEISPDLYEAVAKQVATVAEKNAEIRARVQEICGMDLLPAQRQIVACCVAMLGDTATVLAGLSLICDDASPPIPFDIKSIVLEPRPIGSSTSSYSMEPRSGAAVRKRLFAMLMNDPSRYRSTFSLLGEIEECHLDYGKPSIEPRHPAIDSGLPWPPLERVEANDRDRG